MRPLRIRLQEAWREPGLQSYVVERDYLLSWVLAGISAVPELRETLVFKGGTALKKCYFEDYRFSEDLDFSGLVEAPTGDALADAMDRACEVARDLLAEYAQVEMHCERHVENSPHPGGQEAFRIRARLPWHTRPDISIKVEVTTDERILWPVERRKVMHGYGEAWTQSCRSIPPLRWCPRSCERSGSHWNGWRTEGGCVTGHATTTISGGYLGPTGTGWTLWTSVLVFMTSAGRETLTSLAQEISLTHV